MEDFLRGLLGDLERHWATIRDRLAGGSSDPDVRDHAFMLYRMAERLRRETAGLLADPALGEPVLLPNHLQLYRRWHELAALVEAEPLLIVERYTRSDRLMTHLCRRATEEIGWPLPAPLVSASSNQYYWTSPVFGFVCVPATAESSLLGLPDLFHELGHLLLLRYESELTGDCLLRLAEYINRELQRVKAGLRPPEYEQLYLATFAQWRDAWFSEFASDMIATYLVGPAFGWQHLRLCTSSSADAYRPTLGEEMTHPADEARLRGILLALEQMGVSDVADALRELWAGYLVLSGETRPIDYDLCYPESLIVCLVSSCIEGCEKLGLRPFTHPGVTANTIPTLLIGAWEQFRADPGGYGDWEAQRLAELWRDLGFPAP